MKQSKLLTVLLATLIALVLLTGSIAVPILFRPFYYAHIIPLELCEQSGLTESEIKTAYGEMLDFCLGAEKFSTGILRWSEEGKNHFADVRALFLLDLWGLGISSALLCTTFIAARRTGLRPRLLWGRGPGFWAGAGLGALFIPIGALAAADFDRAFTLFHTFFFPGKDNWLFDPATDEIILILPQVYFMDCAILIFALLVIGCAALVAADLLRSRRKG